MNDFPCPDDCHVYDDGLKHTHDGPERWDFVLHRSACLDHHGDDACHGVVEYRMSMSPSGRNFPRCEAHFEARLNTHERDQRRYPTHAPSDFDEGACGERWDDDY